MSFPDRDPSTVEFRPEFVDGIVGFFGEQFDSLSPKERTHTIGVVANTLASLAMNQTRTASIDGMVIALSTLSGSSNETIAGFVQDKSAGNLYPQSMHICEAIRDAIARRQEQ